MDPEELNHQIIRDFSLIIPKISAIYLYGSHTVGKADERSDIDICLVAGPDTDPYPLQSIAWQNLNSDIYDIRVFELLPLFIQIHILARGELICTRNEADLAEYTYKFWKSWDDQRWYQNPIQGADIYAESP